RVPSDGEIVKGTSTLDEATITGESIPVSKGLKDEVFAGTVNLNGSITVRITKPSHETLFQKIIELVQSAQSEKSPSQLFIERFRGKYVQIVHSVVALIMFILHFVFGLGWNEIFYSGIILLVVASPCALFASIMPATLSAISNGARHGILFKGDVHLEQLSQLKAIAFDKTGTLTKGNPQVTDFHHTFHDEKLLMQMIASIENESNHPLAIAIVNYLKSEEEFDLIHPDKIEDIPGWGIKATIQGEEWLVGKADLVGRSEAE